VAEAIRVTGLNDLVRKLKRVDADLPKTVRVGFNEAAQLVVDYARPRVPMASGRARASVRAQSTRTAVRVSEGGKRAPYMPWLDFGGKVGRNRSVARKFIKSGRYVWAGYSHEHDKIVATVQRVLTDAVRAAGVEVD